MAFPKRDIAVLSLHHTANEVRYPDCPTSHFIKAVPDYTSWHSARIMASHSYSSVVGGIMDQCFPSLLFYHSILQL